MKITVNDEVKVNNFPEGADPLTLLYHLTEEQKKEMQQDDKIFEFELDRYNLPSVLIKVIKSMKKYEICEFTTTKIEKLHTNFANHVFDQYQLFKQGDKVSFFIGLATVSKDEYFYQMFVANKLARITHLKSIAGSFFKLGNYAKAAKLYQKINGYFNFGDSTNNY